MSNGRIGLACDGRRVIAVTFGPEDFRALRGGDTADYLDFLAARQVEMERLCVANSECWSVSVPFDRDDYAAWLAAAPRRAEHADPYLEWAVWVSRQPQRLAVLQQRHPLHHAVPPGEVLKIEMLIWLLPVIVPDAATMRRLGRRLPLPLVQTLMRGLYTGVLRPCPPFRRLSRHRAHGVAVIPADTLACPERREGLAADIREAIMDGPAGRLPSRWGVADHSRLCHHPNGSYPRTLVAGLPLVAAGSTADVDTVSARLIEAGIDRLPVAVWEEYFASLGARLCPGRGADFATDEYYVEFLVNEMGKDLSWKTDSDSVVPADQR